MEHGSSYSQKDLASHLADEHKISPLSEYLKEIVYGGVDGIVTTFAVVAGFTGANSGNVASFSIVTVLLFGFANLFADASSMALGNLLSVRSEKDVYKSEKDKERREIQTNKNMEKAETVEILKQKGFNPSDAQQIATLYAKNEPYWLEFMMNHELEIPNPEGVNPLFTGLATFSAFIVFGFIPLAPYVLSIHTDALFTISVMGTACALLILGFLRWRVTKESMIRSIGETVLLGGVSALIAFIVGSLFSA